MVPTNTKKLHITDDVGGDDSDEDEGEEEVWDPTSCQWSTQNEESPDVPAYNQNFLAAKQTLSDLLSTFPDVSSFINLDDTLGQLKDRREELADDVSPPPIKIALLGGAGQGNSLRPNVRFMSLNTSRQIFIGQLSSRHSRFSRHGNSSPRRCQSMISDRIIGIKR